MTSGYTRPGGNGVLFAVGNAAIDVAVVVDAGAGGAGIGLNQAGVAVATVVTKAERGAGAAELGQVAAEEFVGVVALRYYRLFFVDPISEIM
ncbi:MAG TPA: hypothetical protein VF466_05090 [Candidatus Saccharimonadales bacterium]